MPILSAKVNAYAFEVESYQENQNRPKIRLRLDFGDSEGSDFELETGDNFYAIPTTLSLFPGEPILHGGGRLQGGCGALIYVPAYSSAELGEIPSAIDGWSTLQEMDFNRVWDLLSSSVIHNCCIKISINLSRKDIKFVMPGTYVWQTNSKRNLIIVNLSIKVLQNSWFDVGNKLGT